ncbi:MAG: NADH:ubiquinone oxidoreductase [bacterium]
MFKTLSILFHQGKQYIPQPTEAEVPGIFRGRPLITKAKVDESALAALCPVNAIGKSPVSIYLGKCTFCGECALAFPSKISFTKDYKMATNDRRRLVITAGDDRPIKIDPELVREEIFKYFRGSLKLRQVSAGGDNSCELELNASGNVNFDIGRYGIEFVASPRHADGIVITGPITKNLAEALEICYQAVPEPRIVILVGTDAISGGIFAGSPALDRSFLDKYPVDLFLPGNPVHPLTFLNGVLELIRTRKT